MKYLNAIFLIMFCLFNSSALFAYQIIAEDDKSYSFKGGEITSDPNRYRVIY